MDNTKKFEDSVKRLAAKKTEWTRDFVSVQKSKSEIKPKVELDSQCLNPGLFAVKKSNENPK